MRAQILRFALILCAALAVTGGFARADFLAEARDRVAHGEHESAIPYFEKHLQAATPSAAAYFEFGQALAKVGKEAEAALGLATARLALARSEVERHAPLVRTKAVAAAEAPVCIRAASAIDTPVMPMKVKPKEAAAISAAAGEPVSGRTMPIAWRT